MDPTTLLAEIRSALAAAENSTALEAKVLMYQDAAEKFEALDEWMSKGSFGPSQWVRPAEQALTNTRPMWRHGL